jgi:SAM-dependent methyltransferase
MTACRICGGAPDLSITASERMFGLGGTFWYDRCGECGCLQLRELPPDIARYYGSGYYTFADSAPVSSIHRISRRIRDALLFGRARRLGSWLAPVLPHRFRQERDWFDRTGVTRHSRILDVGCGTGFLLRGLADAGFDRAEGVDPFVDGDIVHRGRVLVRRATMNDLSGPYDLIMLHHSLEHIADQRGTMARIGELLAPGGWCLVRVPTVDSFAWQEYRERWVQLDAPRHCFLHSVKSLERLAELAGLRLDAVVFDSTAFQFEGSELYRRDRPLTELGAAGHGWRQRRAYTRRAHRLNAEQRGDQASFYLRRA